MKKEHHTLCSEGSLPTVVIDWQQGTVTFVESSAHSYEMSLAFLTHASFEFRGFKKKNALHFHCGQQLVQTFESDRFSQDCVAIFIDYFGKLPRKKIGRNSG